jgi:hypothetical protein
VPPEEQIAAPPPCPLCEGKGTRLTEHRGTKEIFNVQCPCKVKEPLPNWIKFVFQDDDLGCMVACLAMILGKTYFECKQYFSPQHDFVTEGTYLDYCLEVLLQEGYAWQARWQHSARRRTQNTPWPPAPWADLHWVMVANLRNGGQHGVIMLRDGRVLDPCWGVIQGLHRYPAVYETVAIYKVSDLVREEV